MASAELSAQQLEILPKIEKLLKIAGRSPEEAEAYLAKAQELMNEYNLDMAAVEANSGDTGKRQDEKLKGGHYKFQRDLWESVAELNFCMYFNITELTRYRTWARRDDGLGMKPVWKNRAHKVHRLVGRTVNVKGATILAQYLEQTVERLTEERLQERLPDQELGRSQLYGKWANSFREGIVERVCEKLYDRRREILREERQAAEDKAREAKERGFETATTGTGVTLAGLNEREKIANYDFLHGEGAWAKKKAREADDRARVAAYWAEVERKEAEWAAANPEAAAKQAEDERKREARNAKRRTGYSSYRSSGDSYKGDWSARRAGYAAGESVSIDFQADRNKSAGSLR